MVEQTLQDLLKGSESITALVSDRIHGLLIPTGSAMPALDYKVVSATAMPTWSSHGSQRIRVEVNCWGAKYDAAVSLRAAVIAALNGYSDGLTSIQFLTSQDLYDYQLTQFRAVCEFYLFTSNF